MDKFEIEKLLRYNLKMNGAAVNDDALGPVVVSILHTVIDAIDDRTEKLKQDILDEIRSSPEQEYKHSEIRRIWNEKNYE